MNTTDKPVGASEFVTQAYNLEDQDSMLAFYSHWAEDYDNQMEQGLGYRSPKRIAEILQPFVNDKSAPVLDIGCGTGLTAKYLSARGFHCLHGVDLSEKMLQIARKRDLYTTLKAADVNHPLEYDDNYFGSAVSSGTFTHGHVGPEPLDDIFRILKPNGFLAATVHQDLWESRGFAAKFAALETSNTVRCLSRTLERYYRNGKPEGWFCVYQKTTLR